MQKTKKAAAKRFKITATGKIKFKRAGMRHNLGNKSSAFKLKLRRPDGCLIPGDAGLIYRAFPYGLK